MRATASSIQLITVLANGNSILIFKTQLIFGCFCGFCSASLRLVRSRLRSDSSSCLNACHSLATQRQRERMNGDCNRLNCFESKRSKSAIEPIRLGQIASNQRSDSAAE